ncbi:hypothetical protein CHU92_11190 [Flavobacterium cyanobacteriorum]|uniref:Thioredoxin domain-containing protein n=1 Tax=Flavobacterium cyanobacteriorum TaxID=2022802 RepID=A0A255Z0Y0_9FLAO|nr:TlpA disulfide reductase family protein [Flavobacterium cyanobacteriorum]OYQ35071.1 hypothetical protein CHU92_11190 [Flavobacterium cyanobacteriorum]
MNFISCILFIVLYGNMSTAQKVYGTWSSLPNTTIQLEGFDGFSTYKIAEGVTDSSGNFSLPYTLNDYGIGYIKIAEAKPIFVVLCGEDIQLSGVTPASPKTVKVVKGTQNRAFADYATQQPLREQALSAWTYLEKLYQTDSIFKSQNKPKDDIIKETYRLKQEEQAFIENLPEDSYVKWFLPIRKLVSTVSIVAQHRPKDIPSTLESFRSINYADKRFIKSGLYKDAIDSYIWFIENTSGSLDIVFSEINRSIDLMIGSVVSDEKLFNSLTDYLFNLLESRSLFNSSEYLALKVLSQNSCTIATDVANKLENYRKLKKGNIAPDIVFGKYTNFIANKKVSSLKEIESSYKLVVFAAGWCEHCQKEVPKIVGFYNKWKEKGLEVILVSLDETAVDFKAFTGSFPFISTCDFLKWNGAATLNYHISGTPTFYLLDKDLKILVKPISVEHIEAWLMTNG